MPCAASEPVLLTSRADDRAALLECEAPALAHSKEPVQWSYPCAGTLGKLPAENAECCDGVTVGDRSFLELLCELNDEDVAVNGHVRDPRRTACPQRCNEEWKPGTGAVFELHGEFEADRARTREKNRKKQAKHRARCKEELLRLNQLLKETSFKLQERRARLCRLKDDSVVLSARLAGTHHKQQPQQPTRRPLQQHFSSSLPVCIEDSVRRPCTCQSCGNMLGDADLPRPTATAECQRQKPCVVCAPSCCTVAMNKNRAIPYTTEGSSDDQSRSRPTNSFRYHQITSYELIAPHILPQDHRSGAGYGSIIRNALRDYEHRVCSQLQAPPSEVCWWFECPIEHVSLSYTRQFGEESIVCNTAAALFFTSASLECLFLLLEHEQLLAAVDPSFQGPVHPFLSNNAAVQQPEWPDAAEVAQVQVSSGAGGRVPLATAVTQALRPMLRKYRSFLPRDTWRRVCLQCMRVMQTALNSLLASKPHVAARTHAASSTVAAGQPSGSVDSAEVMSDAMDVAMSLQLQLVLCELHAVLGEKPPEEQPSARTLKQVRSRMHVLASAEVATEVFVLDHQPVAGRRLLLGTFLNQHQSGNASKFERCMMQLYRQLQFNQLQRATMAARWRSWVHRRAAMDVHIASSLRHLHAAAPCDTSTSPGFLALSRLVASLCGSACQVGGNEGTAPQACQQVTSTLMEHLSLAAADSFADSFKNIAKSESSVGAWHPDSEHRDDKAPPHSMSVPDTADALLHDDGVQHMAWAFNVGWGMPRTRTCGLAPTDGCGAPSVSAAASNCTPRVTPDHQRGGGAAAGCMSSPGLQNGRTHCSFGNGSQLHAAGDSLNEGCKEERTQWCCHERRAKGGSSLALPVSSCHQDVCDRCHPPPTPAQCRQGESHLSGGMRQASRMHESGLLAGSALPWMLGESGQAVADAREACAELLSVHTSDALLHLEFIAPFSEMEEVQNAMIMASQIEMGMTNSDTMFLYRMAAHEERRDGLFTAMQSLAI